MSENMGGDVSKSEQYQIQLALLIKLDNTQIIYFQTVNLMNSVWKRGLLVFFYDSFKRKIFCLCL